jgi:hypothetical protein
MGIWGICVQNEIDDQTQALGTPFSNQILLTSSQQPFSPAGVKGCNPWVAARFFFGSTSPDASTLMVGPRE